MALNPPGTPSSDGIEYSAQRGGGIDARLPRPLEAGFTPEGEAVGGGLVYSSTSDTRPPNASELFSPDPHKSRLKRLRRSVLTSARLLQEEVNLDKSWRWYAILVTLTCRPEDDYCPKQVTAYLKRVRQWAARRRFPLRYVWVHELQQSGKTHYHVVFWIPKAYQMPKADRNGWWPHGMTKTEKVKNNAVGYIAKYATKGQDDPLPKGARMCGCGGLSYNGRCQKAWWGCPGYIRAWCPDYADRPRRLPGGGWIAKDSGDYLPSLFELVRAFPLQVRRKPLDAPPDDWLALAACSCIQTRQLYSGFTL